MATTTTTAGTSGVLPQQWASDLLLAPLQQSARAFEPSVSTTETTPNRVVHYPVLRSDVAASWVAEAAEIAADDAEFGEVTVVPAKVGAVSVVSREMAADSTPAAAEVIGESIANALGVRIDDAFFGALAAPAPAGLAALSGVSEVIGTGAVYGNLDDFAAAIAAGEEVGATLTSFATSPATALQLATVKQGEGSNVPLLQPDPTVAGRSTILGRPLIVSAAIPSTDGLVWGLPAARVRTVIREDVAVETSEHVKFTSDQVVIRGTARIGFGFLHPGAIQRITTTA